MVPACCGSSGILDLVIMFPLRLGIIVGFSFAPYLACRFAFKKLARDRFADNSVGLFIAMMFLILAWAALTWFPFKYMNDHEIAALGLPLSLLGLIGWLLTLCRNLLNTGPRQKVRVIPITRLQAWCQDLIVAALCFGALQALVMRGYFGDVNAVVCSIYLLSGSALGLCVALDVCRRGTQPLRPINRALLVALIVSFGAVTLVLPIIANWRWRRLLKKSGFVFRPA